VENVLALLKAHAIVASMNPEGVSEVPKSSETEQNSSESIESKKLLSYAEANRRYLELEEAIPEAEKFRGGKGIRSNEEKAVAKLELLIEGCRGQAETYAQQGDPYKERQMERFAQFREAENTILCLYLDTVKDSPEFAEILRKQHPWLDESISENEENVEESAEYEKAA